MVPFVGMASGVGGTNRGCAEAAHFLKEHLCVDADWRHIFSYVGSSNQPLEIIASLNRELAAATAQLVREEAFFVSVGGDHSSGIGVWSGVAHALRPRGDLGLVWMDAHMDAHTFQTTESGNIHGMPLAALLGVGDKSLTQIGDDESKVKPENVALIGVRSFERGEADLLNALNVRVYYMDEIADRGIRVVLQEALEKVSQNTAGFGISFDLDSIDPRFTPAVGTSVAGGIDAEDCLSAYSLLEKFSPIGFELVEYNPSLDFDGKSLVFIQRLMEKILQYIVLPVERTVGYVSTGSTIYRNNPAFDKGH